MVIWVTGLSGSGKSTLCAALRSRLLKRDPRLVVLDGDAVRTAFGDDLGYHEADRVCQIKRLQGVAGMLAAQGISVLVAALYANPDLLIWNKAHLPDYFEIYLKADIEFLASRDTKNLYAAARRGEMSNVVGVDIPWQEPRHADLVIEARSAPPADILADQVMRAISAAAAKSRTKLGVSSA